MSKACVVPLCTALRTKNSWLCVVHDAQSVKGERFTAGSEAVQPKKIKTAKIDAGLSFLQQCRFAKLSIPIQEYTFHPIRKWRFDYAWTEHRLAMEVEGGAFLKGGGRHTRGAGFRKDVEKYAEAAILGWRIMRVLPEQVENGQALTWIERALTG